VLGLVYCREVVELPGSTTLRHTNPIGNMCAAATLAGGRVVAVYALSTRAPGNQGRRLRGPRVFARRSFCVQLGYPQQPRLLQPGLNMAQGIGRPGGPPDADWLAGPLSLRGWLQQVDKKKACYYSSVNAKAHGFSTTRESVGGQKP
jgi:hypothetical protein